MIKITFPDGSVREYEQGVNGLTIAESISPALARDVIACGVNGEIVELNRPIVENSISGKTRKENMLSGILLLTCWLKLFRNCIREFSSDLDLQ